MSAAWFEVELMINGDWRPINGVRCACRIDAEVVAWDSQGLASDYRVIKVEDGKRRTVCRGGWL